MPRIQIKRGVKANLPTSGMLAGELYFTTDTKELFVSLDATTISPIKISAPDLTAITTLTGTEDLLFVYDFSTGELKKMSFNDFKTALSIPEGDTDEKVAVLSGGTAGYVWGTDGTNGIFRMGASMSWTKDAGNGFVTLEVATVDCGTF